MQQGKSQTLLASALFHGLKEAEEKAAPEPPIKFEEELPTWEALRRSEGVRGADPRVTLNKAPMEPLRTQWTDPSEGNRGPMQQRAPNRRERRAMAALTRKR